MRKNKLAPGFSQLGADLVLTTGLSIPLLKLKDFTECEHQASPLCDGD